MVFDIIYRKIRKFLVACLLVFRLRWCSFGFFFISLCLNKLSFCINPLHYFDIHQFSPENCFFTLILKLYDCVYIVKWPVKNKWTVNWQFSRVG